MTRLIANTLMFVLALVLVGAGFTAQAQNVSFTGNVGYTLDGNQVELRAERIVNQSPNVTTGTLHLKLRATVGPSPFSTGYDLADANLSYINGDGRLGPGASFTGIVVTRPLSAPPDGTYYLHLYVSQFDQLNTALDTVSFNNTRTFRSGPDVSFVGNVGYSIDGNQVRLDADRIQNDSPSYTTGTIYLTLRATSAPGAFGDGYTLARTDLSYVNGTGQIAPGGAFVGVSTTAAFTAPPDGTYYLHMVVSEFPDLTVALDHLTFDDTVTFGPGMGGGDDHGNDAGSATPMPAGGSMPGHLEQFGDRDLFRVDVTETGDLTVFTTGSTDTVGRVYDASATMLGSDDDSGDGTNFSLIVTVPPGTYYLSVGGFDDARTGSYTLQTHFEAATPPPPTTPPPGTSPPPTAAPVTSGGSGGGAGGPLALLCLASLALLRRTAPRA